MIFYIGVLPHSIRLALLVTFFCLDAQNIEYSKPGCQFQYRVTLSGACQFQYRVTLSGACQFQYRVTLSGACYVPTVQKNNTRN